MSNTSRQPSQKPLFVSFLLDETGSMQSIAGPTVTAFNEYLKGLKKTPSDVLFSLVTFNSNATRQRYIAEPVKDVPPMSHEDYRPSAMTPLIDAACKLIKATDDAVRANADVPDVVVVIQTDGQENCSTEFTASDLAALVKKHTAEGWQFIFLGAGLDAFDAARHVGMDIGEDRAMSYNRARSGETFGMLQEKLTNYASTRNSAALDFSAHDRSRAGDTFHDAKRPKSAPRGRRESTVDDISLRR